MSCYEYSVLVDFDFPDISLVYDNINEFGRIPLKIQEVYFTVKEKYSSLAIGHTKRGEGDFIIYVYSKDPLKREDIEKDLEKKLKGSDKKIKIIDFKIGHSNLFYPWIKNVKHKIVAKKFLKKDFELNSSLRNV
ncbi:MAG: hypothetical protein KKF48_04355 [Nanoarchaeota archaeon]|nr:hypothetical protein [Nanoarchaeota archaeon]MBU1028249.1 hypothetical protein [Nanoarchaeota archaeon]